MDGLDRLVAGCSAVVLQEPTTADGLELLMVTAPMLADEAMSVLRRSAANQPLFQTHRLDLYQRLN